MALAPRNETTDLEVDEKEALEALENVESTFDVKLREYIESQKAEDQVYKTYLYKFDSPTGQDKSLCGQWENDVPDGHTVGLTYGSGRYMIICAAPSCDKGQKKLVRSFRFKIHSHYDDLRKQALQSGAIVPAGAPFYMSGMARGAGGGGNVGTVNPAEVMQSGLSMVSEVIKLLAPILAVKNGGQGPDLSGLMVKQYETMSEVMRHSIMEQGKAYSEVSRRVREVQDENQGEGEEMEEKSMLEQVIPLLEQFVPLILGKGPQAAITAGTVRALPQFQKIVKDSSELRRIVDYVEKTQGKEKTDLLLKKLRIKRP